MSCPKSSGQSGLLFASPLAFLLSTWRTVLKPYCLLTFPKPRICSLPLQSPLPWNPSSHTEPDSCKSAPKLLLIWHFASKKTERPQWHSTSVSISTLSKTVKYMLLKSLHYDCIFLLVKILRTTASLVLVIFSYLLVSPLLDSYYVSKSAPKVLETVGMPLSLVHSPLFSSVSQCLWA
jgi:hypothetical protein